jgi:hypothetical protein
MLGLRKQAAFVGASSACWRAQAAKGWRLSLARHRPAGRRKGRSNLAAPRRRRARAVVAIVGGELAGFVMVTGDEVEQVYGSSL